MNPGIIIDFTKQYNRLRQHVAVKSGTAEGAQQAVSKSKSSVAPLPAVNRPRRPQTAAPSSASDVVNSASNQTKRATDQLTALSKYASRLKHIDEPYRMGASVNRKGPSAHANMKDKSDRATNEQVLDPRTRIILYKMIGRGLVSEINGCVSTGKEVSAVMLSILRLESLLLEIRHRQTFTMLYHLKASIWR